MRRTLAALLVLLASCASTRVDELTVDCSTRPSPSLQQNIETLDAAITRTHGIGNDQHALGVIDLLTGEIAMINPDRIDYAASVPKIGILLAWFTLRPDAATSIDSAMRHELGLMIKSSSNEMASKYSRQLGIAEVQRVLDANGFYDRACGGGLWFGKHYGPNSERVGDPIADHSHAATVRQLLRYYLLLEQGKLVSPESSRVMREIFASPEIPHDDVSFAKGIAGRELEIRRKIGTWKDWHHDSAVVTGGGRHYVIAAMTNHPAGETYLAEIAAAVDDLLTQRRAR